MVILMAQSIWAATGKQPFGLVKNDIYKIYKNEFN